MSGVSTGPHRTREEWEALDPELKRVNVESMRLAASGLRTVEEFNKREQNYTPAMAFGVSALLLERAADELTTLRHNVNRLAPSLAFYADAANHELREQPGGIMASAIDMDGGDIAREALEKKP